MTSSGASYVVVVSATGSYDVVTAGPRVVAMDATYAPIENGQPDPGEVVWAWVPYEEDASQGKDRPVVLLGKDGDTWLALQLTSKDHDRDEAQESEEGRFWLPDSGLRREGAALDRALFESVVEAARAHGTLA